MISDLNISIFKTINQFAGKNTFVDTIIINTAQYLPFIFIITLIYLWIKKENFRAITLFAGYSVLLGLLINFIITSVYFHQYISVSINYFIHPSIDLSV